MTETTSPTSTELRQQAAAAQRDLRRLEVRAAEIPAEIESTERKMKRERRMGARAGDPGASEVNKLVVDRLENERTQMPEAIHDQRLYSFEVAIAAAEARRRELEAEIERAEAEIAPLAESARDAEDHARAARHVVPYKVSRSGSRRPDSGSPQGREADRLDAKACESREAEETASRRVQELQGEARAAADATRRHEETLRAVEERGALHL